MAFVHLYVITFHEQQEVGITNVHLYNISYPTSYGHQFVSDNTLPVLSHQYD